jgi:peptide/nickel transport system ATP-binding protein
VGTRDLPLKDYRRQVQMVFQDSYASLNPRLTIEDSIAFGPQVHGVPRARGVERARDLLAAWAWSRALRRALPARAVGRPAPARQHRARAGAAAAAVILDEAVSALDKSVEAQVLNLLLDLKDEFGLTYVFISHDLNVVRFISDRVMVMYLGQVAEIGDSERCSTTRATPTPRRCCRRMPRMDPDRRTESPPLAGDPPNPINPPSGCRFHPRCPLGAAGVQPEGARAAGRRRRPPAWPA